MRLLKMELICDFKCLLILILFYIYDVNTVYTTCHAIALS